MAQVYRIIVTAIFTTQADRDAAYATLKPAVVAASGAKASRADMTTDDYPAEDAPRASEKVV